MALTRAVLWRCLGFGDDGPQVLPLSAHRRATQQADGYRSTALRLDVEAGAAPGVLILPDGPGPHPLVLYCHAHGNTYTIGADELILGRPALQGPYGPALARLGIASVAIDLPLFGTRQALGPETALAKAAHWQGRPLMGQMLAELSQLLAWAAAQPEVDATRIATLGLSMGATHAYWLAALHPRIAACAHLCAFSDVAPLIATGAHDLHGPYMTVPGLLRHGDMGDVAGLIAPRPQLVCSGALDPLTPAAALEPALDRLRRAYGDAPALSVLTDPASGHSETPAMRDRVLTFLTAHLRP